MEERNRTDEFRAAIGEGALRSMDQVDDEFVELMTHFYLAAKIAADALFEKGLDGCDVCSRLAGLAADAAFSACTQD